MNFHYDLAQAEPIIRDTVVCASADILKGAVVGRDGAITTPLLNMGVSNVDPALVDDVVGVAQEFYDFDKHINSADAIGTSAITTGVTNYIKVLINPLAIYLAEWSQHTSDDADATNQTASSTGATVVGTYTTPGDDCEATWVYITDEGSTAAGAGNLFMIGAASETDWDAVTGPGPSGWASTLKGNSTADTYIHIINPYKSFVVGGSINLSTGTVGDKLAGNDLLMTDTGAIVVLENYVVDKATPMEPLRAERNSGRNYDAATCHLYADIQLMDHILLGGAIATQPTIA